jgi:peroxiredoxin
MANKAPPASQPAIDTVTGHSPKLIARAARSGLQGNTVRKPSISTLRQSSAGLQAAESTAVISKTHMLAPCLGRGLAHNGTVGSLWDFTPALYSMPSVPRALVFLLALALAAGVWLGTRPAQAPATAVVLLDGSTRAGAAVPGQVTLVNFWATTCSVCVAEMPQMVRLFQTHHAQGFSTVAVAMAYDPPASVIRFSESRQLPFDVVIDNTGALARAWGDVQATPTSYLVNRQGQIVDRFVGAPDFDALSRKIEALLRDTAAASASSGAGTS